MGAMAMTNHARYPNMKIYAIDKDALTKTFITLRNINAGEECFLNYGTWAEKEFG
jgi:SET domain-containing protein